MKAARALTGAYEQWVAAAIPLDRDELADKHRELRTDRFRFLRGTYYLWLVRVLEEVPAVLDSARVPLVGDLHVENFGTWHDRRQVRRWGVNDLDELAVGPWQLDLLRLATSAVLTPHIALDDEVVCDTLLEAYATATPALAVDLASESAHHLQALVPPLADAKHFYDHLAAGSATDDLPATVVAAAHRLAGPGWQPSWHVREAGTGSLGHRRRVGVGPAEDGRVHAREAKELGPASAAWAGAEWVGSGHADDPRLPVPADGLYERVLRTIGGPEAVRVDGWQLRDLAPDVVRIELSGLGHKDAGRLLRSMAWACADVHATDAEAAAVARTEAAGLSEKEFRQRVASMVESVRSDFASYR